MVILCILVFPFAVLAELMKMKNGGGEEDEKDHLLAPAEEKDQGEALRTVLFDV